MRRFRLNLVVVITAFLINACTSNEMPERTNLYRIMVGDKYGFIDDNGSVVIDPQFDGALDFSEGLCAVKAGDRKGYINKHGDFVIEIETDNTRIHNFVEGHAIIVRDGKYGFIDTAGQEIIPCTYDAVSNFTNGFSIVKANGKYGVINDNGDVVVDVRWSYLRDPIFEVPEKQNLWGWVVSDTVNGEVLSGLIDKNGEMVIPCEYDDFGWFYNDYIRVCKGDKYGLFDRYGHKYVPVEYEGVTSMLNRLFVFQNDTCWMLNINKKDTICMINQRKEELDFDEESGLFYVGNEKTGLIDSNGILVIDTIYDNINEFKNGKAAFINNGKWGIINVKGEIIIKPKYDFLLTRRDGLFVFGKESGNHSWMYGLLDTCGNTIIPAKYSKINNDTLQLIACEEIMNDVECRAYYDRSGNLIWQDIPPAKKFNPLKASSMTKDDFIEYFESNLTSLDPIEGVYYVTQSSIYQSRENPSIIGSNGTTSLYRAIICLDKRKDFFCICNIGKDNVYCSTFISKIGESNNYAVYNIPRDVDYNDRFELEDPSKFEYKFRTSENNWYNFYCIYEYLKEYPSASEYEQTIQPEWSGSGFAIADGLIATNYHVVNGAKTIRIKGVDGDMETAYNGYVLASDKEHDIAVVKIVDKRFEGFGKIPYSVGKSIAEVGEEVFVLGYPLTTTMGNEVKLTNGIISSTTGFQDDVSTYQISVPVQPGNSGGPLFDSEGNIIGIVSAKHLGAENANYAVKINYLSSLISASQLDIQLPNSNKIKNKSLKKKVKKVKNYVYLIECSN